MIFNTSSQAIPSTVVPTVKAGIDFSNENMRVNILANLRTLDLEKNFTYLARSNFILGCNMVLGSRFTNLEKYDFGFTWEPSLGCFVGLKHESTNKDTLQLGKFFLMFHHNASFAHTVGTDFILDWQKRILEARLGYLHRFNEESAAKFKVNHHGYLDAVFKHKLSSTLTLGVTTGFNLKSVMLDHKSNTLPFGLSFDFKF